MSIRHAGILGLFLSISVINFLFPPTIIAARQSPLIVDHNAVSAFSNLTDAQINTAKSIRLIFEHASVGENISDGLNNLQSQNSKFSRSNWTFYHRGNPGASSKINDFVSRVPSYISTYSAITMKFCYIDTDANFESYRNAMNSLESANPSKTFIWWTMPLETTANTSRNNFNQKVRDYAAQNNKVLFDIADIESNGSRSSEKMVSSYSSDGGHLNSTGSERVAKSFWWLMASINSINPTVSPSPTPSQKPGDADGNGDVDGIDFSIWQRNYNHVVSGGPTKGDFDNSGEVDGIDFSIWQRNYDK